jgi:hypothetical protein
MVPAHRSLRNLLEVITPYVRALDSEIHTSESGDGSVPSSAIPKAREGEAKYRDLSDASPLLKEFYRAMEDAQLSKRARVRGMILILWIVQAKTSNLAFWTLANTVSYAKPSSSNEQWSERVYQDCVRTPNPAVEVKQEQGIGSIAPPPQLSYSKAITTPSLRAALAESARLYGRAWRVYQTKSDFTFSKYRVEEDTYVHIASPLINQDAAIYPEPDMFRPERHIEMSKESKAVFRCSSDGLQDQMQEDVYGRLIEAFIAGVLALWNVQIADGGIAPKAAKNGVFAAVPDKDVRVKIKRRKT